jgi:hypothetical protein
MACARALRGCPTLHQPVILCVATRHGLIMTLQNGLLMRKRGAAPKCSRTRLGGARRSLDWGRSQVTNNMRNPWLKKNPFMSMWLSAANSAAGSIRGQVTAQAKRQIATSTTRATHDALDIWSRALTPSPPTKVRKKRGQGPV